MNKTHFKNNFNKYFEQIAGSQITSIQTNKIDTLEINYIKNNRDITLNINSHIEVSPEGILNFSFHLKKETSKKELAQVLNSITVINEISLYIAQDSFCKEQALEFKYNEKSYFYILIYTNMVESSLEIFEEKLSAEKFKKVAF